MEESKKIELVGHYGATLSLIEVGLGSLLHAFKVPFSGILLSLNQGFILCRAAILSREIPQNLWTTYSISNVAAVLKSLSPAGKKLGPMLSLSMQGLLFNIGILLFGTNPVGLCVGMALLSVWTFLQPLVTYYLFFGKELINAVEYLYEKTLPYHGLKAESLLWIFLSLVAAKMLLAMILAIIAWRTQGETIYGKNYEEGLIKLAREKGAKISDERKSGNAAWMAFKDLLRPLFLVSLLTTGVFLYFSQHNYAQIAWYLLRPIAIGFIFFYISRTLTLDRWLMKIENGKLRSFSLGCQTALAKIRSII
ncbi:hypothetical protein SHI21_15605 [Bacteriovorax sp. PP10]|uniref:Uncharacterized protein n=1 Tax=Bacteriovorax antarcticus TaxID=3088717 RepID=A0ABU5VX58_9BACT|nr:hypothetical protein [Bacteriovorax sp. PP10]MEA9357655.1 hypothetical protein [Bacteriovorax sp. PP10]